MSHPVPRARPTPGPVHLAAATVGLALLALLWSGAGALSLFAPPLPALGVVALVALVFLRLFAPPGAGADAARRRSASAVRPWVRGRRRVAMLAVLIVPLQVSLVTALLAMEWVKGEELPGFFTDYLARPWGWAVLVAMVVGLAPLVEEVIFRGRIQGGLQRRLGPAVAIATTAAVFALAHFQVAGLANRFVGGLVLGVAVYATRSVWAGVTIHAAWNGGVVLLGAVTGDLDPTGRGLAWALPAAAVFVVSAAATAWVVRRLLMECRGSRPLGRPAATAGTVLPVPAAG